VFSQFVFSQPRFDDNNTDFHVACTPKPDMSLGIRETLAALGLTHCCRWFFVTSQLVSHLASSSPARCLLRSLQPEPAARTQLVRAATKLQQSCNRSCKRAATELEQSCNKGCSRSPLHGHRLSLSDPTHHASSSTKPAPTCHATTLPAMSEYG
jgi:hypothetical protein